MNKKDPLILTVELGNDFSLRCVLRLPPMLSMGTTINLPLSELICSELNFTFLLLLDPPGKGLPDGVSLSASNQCVPPGVTSNLTLPVHYTAMDDFAHSNPNHATPSDKIMVQDRFCHGSVPCNLVFAPSSKDPIY